MANTWHQNPGLYQPVSGGPANPPAEKKVHPRITPPQPVNALLCDFCGHRWDNHMGIAGEEPVGYQHCAALMMSEGRARVAEDPWNPVPNPAQPAVMGPVGPPGRNGLDAASVVAANVIHHQDGKKVMQLTMSDGRVIPVAGYLP